MPHKMENMKSLAVPVLQLLSGIAPSDSFDLNSGKVQRFVQLLQLLLYLQNRKAAGTRADQQNP